METKTKSICFATEVDLACLLKLPKGRAKGVVTFTTPERYQVIDRDPAVREVVAALKPHFVLGLHHNWHDHAFHYDPLFDFSMAGEGDLREANGADFPLLPMDACNFAPACFKPGIVDKFWDLLVVSRAVGFKGLGSSFEAIRALYDRGRNCRVLMICPVSPTADDVHEHSARSLRAAFEQLFTAEERKRVTLLTIDFDYPFPLDLPTLAHFYRSSRVFAHFAPDERRVRVAGYAWASGLAVVANAATGSLLPPQLQSPPNFFNASAVGFVGALEHALDSTEAAHADQLRTFVSETDTRDELRKQISRLCPECGAFEGEDGFLDGLDIRLGRHHGLATNGNRVPQTVSDFATTLFKLTQNSFQFSARDPEMGLVSTT